LPTYNRCRIIEDSIISVINQSYTNWELIIIDDGSLDDTQKTVLKYTNIDTRIKYFKNIINLGLPSTRNVGLSYSSGDLIFFIEDDLTLDINCIEILVDSWSRLIIENENLGVLCPSLIENYNVQSQGRSLLNFTKKIYNSRLKNSPVYIDPFTGLIFRNYSPIFSNVVKIEDCHACSFYNKNLFNNYKFEQNKYKGGYLGEESDFFNKIKQSGYVFFFQPKAITFHNIINEGGCRLPFLKWTYFFIRNHMIYLLRTYKIKSIIMIPYFIIYLYIIISLYTIWSLIK
jgi:glycosyltransferase involved in cell wall biosynthesis